MQSEKVDSERILFKKPVIVLSVVVLVAALAFALFDPFKAQSAPQPTAQPSAETTRTAQQTAEVAADVAAPLGSEAAPVSTVFICEDNRVGAVINPAGVTVFMGEAYNEDCTSIPTQIGAPEADDSAKVAIPNEVSVGESPLSFDWNVIVEMPENTFPAANTYAEIDAEHMFTMYNEHVANANVAINSADPAWFNRAMINWGKAVVREAMQDKSLLPDLAAHPEPSDPYLYTIQDRGNTGNILEVAASKTFGSGILMSMSEIPSQVRISICPVVETRSMSGIPDLSEDETRTADCYN